MSRWKGVGDRFRQPRLSTAPASEASGFDPSKHSVAEVLAHLDANPDSADDILAAEADGKARKTILAVTGDDGDGEG